MLVPNAVLSTTSVTDLTTTKESTFVGMLVGRLDGYTTVGATAALAAEYSAPSIPVMS